MNYIYDVLSNFQLNYFDFFEWNKDDDVIRIRKIPIIKVNDIFYYNLKYNNVKVSDELLDKIENRTEIFKNKGIDTIYYAGVFTNGKEAIIVKYDNKGNNIYKSSMMIDEEREVIEDIQNDDVLDLNYEVISNGNKSIGTRKESAIINRISKDISKLYDNKEYDKLSYLYFECFNEKCSNYIKIKDDLINNLTNSKVVEIISSFIKLISNV